MVSATYYNEFDPKAAAWLRELIAQGHLPHGDVDERSIEDVVPSDLAGYRSCHFFAGIGGWAYALRLAGWPDDQPVWTGSCPCQPFSETGAGAGFSDERHLWPAFAHVIAQCRPAIVFGEQVASKLALQWWDTVSTDLENQDYACAAVDLCAAGVGGQHARQRLFWVAHANRDVRERWRIGQAMPGRSEWDSSRSENSRHPCIDEGQWIADAYGNKRRFPRDLSPVVDGIPSGVAAMRGIGNAIVPQLAASFIAAYTTTKAARAAGE